MISTLRPDVSFQSCLVNAEAVAHPASGNRVPARATAGAVKLANLRVRPVVTMTFYCRWQYVNPRT